MTSNVVAGTGFLNNLAASSTKYFAPFGAVQLGNWTSETQAQTQCQSAFTAQNCDLLVFTNGATSGTPIVTLMKNGSGTGVTVTVPNGFTGHINNTTGFAAYVPSDTCDWQVQTAAGGLFGAGYSFVCVNAYDHNTRLNAVGTTLTSAAHGSTFYVCACGNAYLEASTESNVGNYVQTAGTWESAQVQVQANSNTGATSIQSRINGVNGNMVISCTGGVTGLFTDLTHSDAISASNKIDWGVTIGTGAGTFTMSLISSRITYPTSVNDAFYMGGSGGEAIASTSSANQQLRWPINRGIAGQEDFLTSRAIRPYYRFTMSGTVVQVTANTYAGAPMSVTAVKEGVLTNVGVSITAGFTGFATDISGNSAIWNPTDRWSYMFTNRAATVGTGSLTLQSITSIMADTPAGLPSMKNVGSVHNVGSITV